MDVNDALEDFIDRDDEQPLDPTLRALMEDAFGPPEDGTKSQAEETHEDKLAKGLETVNTLSSPDAVTIRWLHEGGVCKPPPLKEPRLCFACAKPSPTAGCSKCGVAGYCGRECQTADWGKKGAFGGHKLHCNMYKTLGKQQLLNDPAFRRATLEALLARIRLYMCPFVLSKSGGADSVKGKGKGKKQSTVAAKRGFAFVQLGCTLAEMALPCPRSCSGHRLVAGDRAILLHFVTLAEFESEVVASDPEAFSAARAPLASAVASHDEKQELVVLMRTACGLVHVATHPLVPEWRVAVTMASEYDSQEALQLDLDDA